MNTRGPYHKKDEWLIPYNLVDVFSLKENIPKNLLKSVSRRSSI